MNELKVFDNKDFGGIRAMQIDGQPWFVGKDVARALGYGGNNKNSAAMSHAIKRHVDAEDKGMTETVTPGGKQLINVINESGLYSLVLSSKLPKAKAFKHWVTSEVLPAIRQMGGYVNGNETDFIGKRHGYNNHSSAHGAR